MSISYTLSLLNREKSRTRAASSSGRRSYRTRPTIPCVPCDVRKVSAAKCVLAVRQSQEKTSGASKVEGLKPPRPTRCRGAEMRLVLLGTRAGGALGHGTLRVDGGHRSVELPIVPLAAEALNHLICPHTVDTSQRAVSTW